MAKRRIGIVGYGHVGKYLHEFIQKRENLEVVFIWNRTTQVLKDVGVSADLSLESLDDFTTRKCDLIVEVAHPDITRDYGTKFLKHADYMIGSPTALADEDVELPLRELATEGPHGVYIPVGALWGAEDLRRMADSGSLEALTITMAKHPSAFRLTDRLEELNKAAVTASEPITLYDGGIRSLCRMAPNNVNTMAAAAIAAHSLGFDKIRGRLIADPSAQGWHIITVEALGSKHPDGSQFSVCTERKNPTDAGAVTGSATYASFGSSLLNKLYGWTSDAVQRVFAFPAQVRTLRNRVSEQGDKFFPPVLKESKQEELTA